MDNNHPDPPSPPPLRMLIALWHVAHQSETLEDAKKTAREMIYPGAETPSEETLALARRAVAAVERPRYP